MLHRRQIDLADLADPPDPADSARQHDRDNLDLDHARCPSKKRGSRCVETTYPRAMPEERGATVEFRDVTKRYALAAQAWIHVPEMQAGGAAPRSAENR